MKLNIEKKVVVLTPCIGTPKVADAIASVQAQTYTNIEHLIVLDGGGFYENFAKNIVVELLPPNITLTSVPYNTGKNGFYGHRIYSGYPHFIDADYIFLLDEDNWYEPDHVKSLVEVLDRGNDFAYSLRKIFKPDKTYVCDDNCEALGKWPIFMTHGKNEQFLVDTSSFAFNTKFLQATSQYWHHGWGGDRHYLYNALNHKPKWDCNMKHTLCYRLDGNANSVNEDFFLQGNEVQLQNYNGKLPWVTNV